jgi:hypothetical protein
MTRGRIKQVNKCTTPTKVIEEDERTYYSLKGYNIFFLSCFLNNNLLFIKETNGIKNRPIKFIKHL